MCVWCPSLISVITRLWNCKLLTLTRQYIHDVAITVSVLVDVCICNTFYVFWFFFVSDSHLLLRQEQRHVVVMRRDAAASCRISGLCPGPQDLHHRRLRSQSAQLHSVVDGLHFELVDERMGDFTRDERGETVTWSSVHQRQALRGGRMQRLQQGLGFGRVLRSGVGRMDRHHTSGSAKVRRCGRCP